MSTQKPTPRALMIWVAVLTGASAGIAALNAQTAPTVAPPMNALSVEPRVPRLGVTPCVVEVFRDLYTGYYGEPMFEPEFEYTPPADCPGPWAKVIFSVDLRSTATTELANTYFGLGDASRNEFLSTELMVVGVQFNAGQPSWRVERDITEYSALLRQARPGFARDTDGYFRDPGMARSPFATGRMIFYPATPTQPAPQVPDAIFPVFQFGTAVGPLPRNIERAYLDVYAQLPPGFWFSCVPANAASSWPLLIDTSLALGDNVQLPGDGPGQGCSGSSYRDLVVLIDGQPAGVAPIYPWLNSDLNHRFERSVDVPVPTPQSINLMPYRVDLTPYAALLSNGAPHDIQLEYTRAEGVQLGGFRSAQLLVYLDRGSTQVTGALTRNTLAGSAIQETQVRNDWNLTGAVLHGDVERHYRRQFEIAGYVNTSKGRINSTVNQDHLLTNTQVVNLDGVTSPQRHSYAQNLDLASTTTRRSLRVLGTKVLALDNERYHYPLKIDYQATGGISTSEPPFVERASAAVLQGHHQQGSYSRPAGSYANRVYANFAGSRTFDALSGQSSDWQGARSHYFYDSAGSCSRERVTWLGAVLTSHTQGQGCPDGRNRVRGFAHPDGSPDNLGWLR